jgi:hypothetical protein
VRFTYANLEGGYDREVRSIGSPRDLAGEWELAVDLPGSEGVRGHVLFDAMGDVLVQRTTLPVPDAPDSWCMVVRSDDGGYVQHYFDSRGVARLCAMTFDGRTWTLERTKPCGGAMAAAAATPSLP